MTTCPDTGTLRAHIDGEADESVGAHAANCARCTADLATLRDRAAATSRALALLAPPEPGAHAPAAGEAVRAPATGRHAHAPAGPDAHAAPAPSRPAAARPLRRRARGRRARRAVATIVLLAVGFTVGLTPGGRQAVASFLSQFRSERIQIVTIDPYAGANPFDALGALGTVSGVEGVGHMLAVGSVAEAEERTGMALAQPAPGTVPAEFGRPQQILVTEPVTVRVDFDAARVRAWLDQHGSGLDVPAGLDGTALVVDLPAAAALTYRGPDWAELVVGQAGQVTAQTEGPLDLEQVRAFLLELPGLPPQAVNQLRAIEDWRSTLPLPIPADQLDWSETTVAGQPAVRLEGTRGFGSAILWQSGGIVHGVGGLVDADVVERIAEGLRRP